MENSEDTISPPTNSLYLQATELRLGLPGSNSPERDSNDIPQKHHLYLKWVFSGSPGSDTGLVIGSSSSKDLLEEEKKNKCTQAASTSKAQVVGWPPIRSFRKNTMASLPPKTNHDEEVHMGSGCLYVKVRMDGAPYMRKVDLKTYGSYMELSSALENMFSCFTIGPCGSLEVPNSQDGLSESRPIDLMHGSDFVLIYEDKDGDWMLVGDVPWKMFTETCRRLRITKSSEANGLAPRAVEKQLKE